MSSLPNSKSSFLRAAQSCGALALASAMVLPMAPALAQNAAPLMQPLPPLPLRLLTRSLRLPRPWMYPSLTVTSTTA